MDVTKDTISTQMDQANSLPHVDTPDVKTPGGLQKKIDALKASSGEGKPEPVEVGYVQTDEELTGTRVVI